MSYAWRIGRDTSPLQESKLLYMHDKLIIFLIIQVGHNKFNKARVKFWSRLDGPREDLHDQPCVTAN